MSSTYLRAQRFRRSIGSLELLLVGDQVHQLGPDEILDLAGPTSGMRTSTVARKAGAVRWSTGGQRASPFSVTGACSIEPATGGFRGVGGETSPGPRGGCRVATVELVDDAGQPVGPQYLVVTSTPPSCPTRNASRIASRRRNQPTGRQ